MKTRASDRLTSKAGTGELAILPSDRPTRPASEFLEAVGRELPDVQIGKTRAEIQRAAELLRKEATPRAISK
jgi:hypothetical protein